MECNASAQDEVQGEREDYCAWSTEQQHNIHLTNISLKAKPGELALSLVLLAAVSRPSSTAFSENAQVSSPRHLPLARAMQAGFLPVMSKLPADALSTALSRFVPQVPFIFIATARDNILFGKPLTPSCMHK